MKTHSLILYIFLALILTGPACSRKAKLTGEYIDSLKRNYKSLATSVDTSWNSMMNEDNRKLAYLKKLLNEVSFTNNYDSIKLASLQLRLNDLKSIRYDQYSLKESRRIDLYDSLTIQLVPEIEKFATSNPKYDKFPLMKELIDAIDELDNAVLFKRSHYDNSVDQFNDFVNANLDALKEIYPDSDLNNKPVFRISTD
jgi:hypothetical protein